MKAVIMILVMIIGSPFATIWAVNTLFGTGIPITLTTWLAAFWINLGFGTGKIGRFVNKLIEGK